MKLLFVLSSLNTGGAQRAASNLIMSLPEDVEVEILLNSADGIVYPYRGKLRSVGMAGTANRESTLYQLRVFIKRLAILRRLKRTEGYTAVISFQDSANFANILTGKRHARTVVSTRTMLSADPSPRYRYLVVPLAKCLYNKADVVVPNSYGGANDLKNNLKISADKVTPICNGFDAENMLEQSRQEPDTNLQEAVKKLWAEDSFVFVNAGRLDRAKCQWSLIRAFSKVAAARHNARLLILGDGAEREYLEKLVRDYGLTERVQLLPFQKNPYVIYAKSDVIVMSSLWEGFPNVLCEGMICGLPAIAADFRSGAREILAPDTDCEYQNTGRVEHALYGVITPVCTGDRLQAADALQAEEELLADAMLEMLDDKALREKYSEAARQRMQDFTAEAKCREWLEVIQG